MFLFSLSSLSTTHLPGLPAWLPAGSRVRSEQLTCTGEGGRGEVFIMTESSVLHWSSGSWTSHRHSLELSRVSQLGFAHQPNKGWVAAGLVSQGNNTEVFLLRRDSLVTREIQEKILTCKLDCSGSLLSIASQNKLYILRQGLI